MMPTSIATTTLSVHPSLQKFPCLGDEEIAALTISIKERGVLVPLFADEDGRVYEGRARLAIAEALGLATVPVIVRECTDPLAFAIESRVNRGQLSRSGIAFLLFEQHPQLATRVNKGGRPKKPVTESQVSGTPGSEESFSKIASKYVVPREYFVILLSLFREATPEEWDWLRHCILFEEVPIRRAHAGFWGKRQSDTGGIKAAKIFEFTEQGELWEGRGLFPRSVKSLHTCWDAWEADHRFHAPMVEQWKGVVEQMPDALAQITLDALKRRLKK